MKLSYPVDYVIKKIMDAGGQAFLVGGTLRDWMLKRPVIDYDIASSFPPEEIEKIFSSEKTWPSGKRFGTITVQINDTAVEITTFRKESEYTDNRHPDQVTYISDIHQDLARRDFTINAMAYNPYCFVDFVDPFGGKEDLHNQIIRCVGNPSDRFTEDPLRIMRGIRFSAQLNFDIEKETKNAMKACSHMLKKVSAERLRSELDGLLISSNPDKGLSLLQVTSILAFLFKVEDKEFREPIDFNMIKNIEPSLTYRLTTLISILYPLDVLASDLFDLVKKILTKLKYDKKTTNHILKMLQGYYTITHMNITPFSVRKLLGKMGLQDTRQCLKWYQNALQIHKNTSFHQRVEHAAELLKNIIERKDPVYFEEMAINGKDVLHSGIGVKDARIVGEALDLAYQWVLEKPERNNPDCLIKMLKEYYSSH